MKKSNIDVLLGYGFPPILNLLGFLKYYKNWRLVKSVQQIKNLTLVSTLYR